MKTQPRYAFATQRCTSDFTFHFKMQVLCRVTQTPQWVALYHITANGISATVGLFFTCKYYSTVNTILTVKGRLSRTKLILTPSQPCSLLNFIWCSNWWVLLSNPPAMQSKGKKTADVFVKMEAWSEVGGRTIAKALAGGQLLQLTHSNCVWQHITQHKHVFHKPTTILTVFS